MRNIEITLYRFEELCLPIQQAAINDIYNSYNDIAKFKSSNDVIEFIKKRELEFTWDGKEYTE